VALAIAWLTACEQSMFCKTKISEGPSDMIRVSLDGLFGDSYLLTRLQLFWRSIILNDDNLMDQLTDQKTWMLRSCLHFSPNSLVAAASKEA